MVDSPDPVGLCYNSNRILLSMIGLWPHQTPRESWLRKSLLFLLVMSRIIPQFAALVTKRNNFDNITESIVPIGAAVIALIQLINLTTNREKVKDLLMRMRKDWENAISATETKIMKRHAEESVRWTKIYTITFYIGGTLRVLGPLIAALSVTTVVDPVTNITISYKQLPVVAEYGVDIETYFYPLWFHTYLTAIAIVTIFVSCDSIFVVYAQHGCTKFRLLKFADAIESTYTTSQLFQVGVCILLMSISGLHLVTKLNKPGELVGYAAIVCTLMLRMLLYSWPSQSLMDQSLEVSEAVYSMEWYRVSIRSRKLLLQMMTRGRESCKITAGKLYVMSMENYSKILSSSFSYFTVLSTIRDESADTK